MKSIDVTLQHTYLTKNCEKKNIVQHLAKLFHILDIADLPLCFQILEHLNARQLHVTKNCGFGHIY